MNDKQILLGLGFITFPQDSMVLEAMRIARQDELGKLRIENEELKKEIEENQQISDRISSLIVERDEWKSRWEMFKSLLDQWDNSEIDDMQFLIACRRLKSGGKIPSDIQSRKIGNGIGKIGGSDGKSCPLQKTPTKPLSGTPKPERYNVIHTALVKE